MELEISVGQKLFYFGVFILKHNDDVRSKKVGKWAEKACTRENVFCTEM